MKRRLYEDGALPASTDISKKAIKTAAATVSMAVPGTPTVISVPSAQVVMASGLQQPLSGQPSLKKPKTAGEWEKLKPSSTSSVTQS